MVSIQIRYPHYLNLGISVLLARGKGHGVVLSRSRKPLKTPREMKMHSVSVPNGEDVLYSTYSLGEDKKSGSYSENSRVESSITDKTS